MAIQPLSRSIGKTKTLSLKLNQFLFQTRYVIQLLHSELYEVQSVKNKKKSSLPFPYYNPPNQPASHQSIETGGSKKINTGTNICFLFLKHNFIKIKLARQRFYLE